MASLFVSGALQHVPLLSLVLGRSIGPLRAAVRADVSEFSKRPFDLPYISENAGKSVSGFILDDFGDTDAARLSYYLQAFDAVLSPTAVISETQSISVQAQTVCAAQSSDPAWKMQDWCRDFAPLVTLAAQEYMDDYEVVPAPLAASRYPMVLLRASSLMRAQQGNTPADLRSSVGSEMIEVAARRRPYANYFALEEIDLSFPRFDGTPSPVVTRAAFVGGDAVTVLPYDPARDRVLVIEQFRFAPFVRGDRHPWSLEPIAGRIDPGETPQQAAHREMAEEANIVASRLLSVADYYPSPGAWTEYLYTYVAIADLPDGSAGIAGLEIEAEDIKSHVLSFEDAMALVTSGEANTGPLVLTLLWLQANRKTLQSSA